ncbi:MAG: CvpA family protein [Betaproteobacteria bacterium]
MTWFDYAALGVIGLSMVVGVFRGFAREVISLIGWIAAAIVASSVATQAAEWVPAAVSSPVARVALAFVIVFLAVIVVSALAGWLLASLIKAAGLGLADRILGALFGFARGALVVLVVVMLSGLTMLPREAFWREAVLSGPLETAVMAAKPLLPAELAQRMKFNLVK